MESLILEILRTLPEDCSRSKKVKSALVLTKVLFLKKGKKHEKTRIRNHEITAT